MSANRCFGSSNKSNSTSSDYTIANKQKTIFTGIVNQVNSPTKFVKSNGQSYNKNFKINNCNELTSSKSYDLLLDVTKGRRIANPLLPTSNGATIGTSSNEAWSGNLYSINYNKKGIDNVVDTSYNAGNDNIIIFPMTQTAIDADSSWNGLYPGVMVDPSYQLFYDACSLRNNNGNGNVWRNNLVDMSLSNIDFTQNNYYKQHTLNSQKLYGMNFPEKVNFKIDDDCSEKIVTILPGEFFITQAELNTKFTGCTKIVGDLIIFNFENATIDLSVFDNLTEIDGSIMFQNNLTLPAISGFPLLQTINGQIDFINNNELTQIAGFSLLQTVNAMTIVNNPLLTEISGFPALKQINGIIIGVDNAGNEEIDAMTIVNNPKLITIGGFTALETVGGDIKITDNGRNLTGDNNSVVTTIIGFNKFSTVPEGITGHVIINGISATKLLEFKPVAIRTNIEAAVAEDFETDFSNTISSQLF